MLYNICFRTSRSDFISFLYLIVRHIAIIQFWICTFFKSKLLNKSGLDDSICAIYPTILLICAFSCVACRDAWLPVLAGIGAFNPLQPIWMIYKSLNLIYINAFTHKIVYRLVYNRKNRLNAKDEALVQIEALHYGRRWRFWWIKQAMRSCFSS